MNLSSINNTTLEKILTLTNQQKDVVFLSDLRLNSVKNVGPVEYLRKEFQFLGYDFFHNSKLSNRGTGILIKKTVSYNIIQTEKDMEENFLLAKININDTVIIIGSVYGPNVNDDIFSLTIYHNLYRSVITI